MPDSVRLEEGRSSIADGGLGCGVDDGSKDLRSGVG
jgi:hypothetical protein